MRNLHSLETTNGGAFAAFDRPTAQYSRGAPLWQRLLTRQGAALDRIAVRAIELAFMSGAEPELDHPEVVRARIEEARARYAAPALFDDPNRYFRPVATPAEFRVSPLGRLRRGRRLRITYESQYQPFDPSFHDAQLFGKPNRINRVHLWQHDEIGRPTVVYVHFWGGGTLTLDERVVDAARLYRAGFNVALFTLPLHGARKPTRALFSGQLFLSRDIQRQNEAFGQSVSDLRLLLRWLSDDQRSGPIALVGISLGGYVTALMAGLEPSLGAAVAIAAPSSFPDLWWHHGRNRPGRAHAEAAGITLADLRGLSAIHCPLSHSPKLPSERLMIIWGAGDRIVPAAHAEALNQHWSNAATLRFIGGHIAQYGRRHYLGQTIRWLRQRLYP